MVLATEKEIQSSGFDYLPGALIWRDQGQQTTRPWKFCKLFWLQSFLPDWLRGTEEGPIRLRDAQNKWNLGGGGGPFSWESFIAAFIAPEGQESQTVKGLLHF